MSIVPKHCKSKLSWLASIHIPLLQLMKNVPDGVALIRHTPAGAGNRYPHDSGAAGSQRCEDHDGLHPCAQSRSVRRPQSRRLALKSRMLRGPDNKPFQSGGSAFVLLGEESCLLGSKTIRSLCGKKPPNGSFCGPPHHC